MKTGKGRDVHWIFDTDRLDRRPLITDYFEQLELERDRHKYQPKGYDIDKLDEAMTSKAVSYLGAVVGLMTVLSYFFFDNWLLELLIIWIFMGGLSHTFLHHLTNEALQYERFITDGEFSRMYAEVEELKVRLSNK